MSETPQEKSIRLSLLAEKENRWAKEKILKKIDKMMAPHLKKYNDVREPAHKIYEHIMREAQKEYDDALQTCKQQFASEFQEIANKFTYALLSANAEYSATNQEEEE